MNQLGLWMYILAAAASLHHDLHVQGAIPTNCAMMKLENPERTDGEHLLEIWDGKVAEIYCHDMESGTPKEYITLKQGVTYSEYFTSIPGSSITTFTKVGLDLETRIIIHSDFEFSTSTTPGGAPVETPRVRVLQAMGCGGNNGFPAIARAKLDLRGTGFSLPNLQAAHKFAGSSVFLWAANPTKDVIDLQGSGNCGGCQVNPINLVYTQQTIDECAYNYTCDAEATCYDTLSSYICEVDECELNTDNCDSTLATCNNTLGSYTCTCNDGYTGDGTVGNCTDLDECVLNTHNCDVLATCINTNGSFTCACNAGYTGNGTTGNCNDVDECALNTEECDPIADCTNTVGSYDCACNVAGHTGDGTAGNCTDVNECALNMDNCDDTLASCINTVGSFTCVCNEGYAGAGTNGTCVESVATSRHIKHGVIYSAPTIASMTTHTQSRCAACGEMECARMCHSNHDCVSASYVNGRCDLHAAVTYDSDDMVSVPGAAYIFLPP